MRSLFAGLVVLVSVGLSGCSNQDVEVIDLNRVLDILEETLVQLDGDDSQSVNTTELAKAEVAEDESKSEQFLAAYRTNLNKAKLMSKPLGVSLNESGAILGYSDLNDNRTQDAGEPQLFTVQIDAERGRLLASDMDNHHRDHHYRPSGGFFTGYLLASMMGRQNGFYSGNRAGLKPNFASTNVSPQNYHSSAVSQARARASASSVRTRSGSGGFSFGK